MEIVKVTKEVIGNEIEISIHAKNRSSGEERPSFTKYKISLDNVIVPFLLDAIGGVEFLVDGQAPRSINELLMSDTTLEAQEKIIDELRESLEVLETTHRSMVAEFEEKIAKLEAETKEAWNAVDKLKKQIRDSTSQHLDAQMGRNVVKAVSGTLEEVVSTEPVEANTPLHKEVPPNL